ncbi:hypothetical protein JX265_007202 [Neoarthrinium moseri]|uniref:Cytochrome P450 monooxygenase n=1 Tax=Neoarthrinium moseri TaxID=1658444 RepID=A0A9Q0ANM1_9PEZI|nr:hypothetical protein JX265_007202 [Neoarthrinium moseri]
MQLLSSMLETAALVACASIIISLIWNLLRRLHYYQKVYTLPLAQDYGLFTRFCSSKARSQFIANFKTLMRKGFDKNKYGFRVDTDLGEVIILAPHYAQELREDNGLSAGIYTNTELMGFIPGMEAFAFAGTHRQLMHDVITKRLNRALRGSPLTLCQEYVVLMEVRSVARLVGALSTETSTCLKSHWGDSKGYWHSVALYDTMLRTVARVSVRAFLGEEFSQNKRWVEINSQYTVIGLGAVMALRWWPRYLLPVIHHFHPKVRATRELLTEARNIIASVRSKRNQEEDRDVCDSLDWFEELAKYRGEHYDAAVAQLTFAVAAMHSTTDHLCQVLIDLSDKPQVVVDLRTEIATVIARDGWKYEIFSELKLMDSVMKESQRLKPINRVFNKRAVLKDISLSNGITLPQGSFVAISSNSMRDPNIYHSPDDFNAYRFIERAKKKSDVARLCGFSSVSIDHTGFGFGKHACPGRTYVTQELKILLSYIILKYDWKLPNNYEPKQMNNGFDSLTDLTASVLVRRRNAGDILPN